MEHCVVYNIIRSQGLETMLRTPYNVNLVFSALSLNLVICCSCEQQSLPFVCGILSVQSRLANSTQSQNVAMPPAVLQARQDHRFQAVLHRAKGKQKDSL